MCRIRVYIYVCVYVHVDVWFCIFPSWSHPCAHVWLAVYPSFLFINLFLESKRDPKALNMYVKYEYSEQFPSPFCGRGRECDSPLCRPMFLWVEPLEVYGFVFSRTFVLKILVSFGIAAFGMNVIVMDLAFLGLDPDRDHMVIGRSRCNSLICDPGEGIPNLKP